MMSLHLLCVLLCLCFQGLHSEVVVLVDIVSQLRHGAHHKQPSSGWLIVLG